MAGRLIVVVGFDGIELVDVACVTTGFDYANRLGADPAYQVVFATPMGRPVRCDSGLELRGQTRIDGVDGPIDTLVVSGGLGHEAAAANPRFVGQVVRLARLSRRVSSVCTGATVLAAAGLLDNRRATTHWFEAERLATRYPRVHVDPAPIFVRDGAVATSGGVTASLDLTLSFIEEDHGAEIARRVAKGMVTYLKRPGSQAQLSVCDSLCLPEHFGQIGQAWAWRAVCVLSQGEYGGGRDAVEAGPVLRIAYKPCTPRWAGRLLGGDPGDAPGLAYVAWRKALRLPGVRGLVVGRALLYPPDDDVAAAVDTAVSMLEPA